MALYAVWLLAVAIVAHLLLSPTLALTAVMIAAALGLGRLVLSVRHALVVWLEYERGQLQAVAAIHKLLPLRAPLPPMTRWAGSPRLLNEVLVCVKRAAQTDSAPTVLECGSGASTLAIGYALEVHGAGRIISLDHDRKYAEQTRGQAVMHGLGNFVEVVHAPLVPQTVEGESYPWYDTSALKLPGPVSVLVVDGPPSATRSRARFPAFPLLERHLADEAFVILDDAERPDEREAMERWVKQAKGTMTVEYSLDGRGVAVAHYRRTAS